MAELAPGWKMDLERGPDCLIIRLHASQTDGACSEELADRLWRILEQHLVYRLILELDDVGELDSGALGQLTELSRRICLRDGLLRICGLSEQNRQALCDSRLADNVAHYPTRQDALMRRRPLQPR